MSGAALGTGNSWRRPGALAACPGLCRVPSRAGAAGTPTTQPTDELLTEQVSNDPARHDVLRRILFGGASFGQRLALPLSLPNAGGGAVGTNRVEQWACVFPERLVGMSAHADLCFPCKLVWRAALSTLVALRRAADVTSLLMRCVPFVCCPTAVSPSCRRQFFLGACGLLLNYLGPLRPLPAVRNLCALFRRVSFDLL